MCLLSGLFSIEKKVQSPPNTEKNKQLAFKMFQVRGKTTLLCHLSNWANNFNSSVFVSFSLLLLAILQYVDTISSLFTVYI